MIELLYVSVSPQGLSQADLQQILEKARENNTRLGITGMMTYFDREIMQLLEGEEDAVVSLFSRISADPRHTMVRVFYQGPIRERAFCDWSMAYVPLDNQHVDGLKAEHQRLVRERLSQSMNAETANQGRDLFLALREML